MRARAETMLVIAAAEVRAAIAARLVQVFGGLFALLALAIAVAGLGASGELLVQGFTRTGVSLLMLSLYLLPLLGLVTGAGAFGAEHGGIELLLAQPISRSTVFLGRSLGLAVVIAGVGVVGLGLAGAVVAISAGTAGLGGYIAVTAGSIAVGVAALALGILIGVLARRRSAAVGAALAVWFCLAVLYDFAAIAVLQFVGNGEPGGLLVGLLALNPIDGVRALLLTLLGADVLLGPTGASVQRLFGPGGGAAVILTCLFLALCAPLLAARAVFRRRDF
jgi:ABC-type transport system involved in multi-copper enzyme maturation permease subunit